MERILRLEELRKERGLSQRKLAKELNLSLSTIRRWERTLYIRSIKHAVLLALYFDVSTDYLFGLSDKRKHKYS